MKRQVSYTIVDPNRSRVRSFAKGAVSSFDLLGGLYRRKTRVGFRVSSKSDSSLIEGDWSKVGEDLRGSFVKLKGELRNSGGGRSTF